MNRGIMYRPSILVIVILSIVLFPQYSNAVQITGGQFYFDSGKSGLASGEAASSNNFTNIVDGVGRVIIYFDGPPSASNFEFRTGNSNNLTSWDTLPINTTADIDVSISHAIVNLGSVTDAWVEVNYDSSYLYFGNLVGDANYDGSLDPIDAISIIDYLNGPSANIYNPDYDINNDDAVSPGDILIILNKLNSSSGNPTLASGPFNPTGPQPISFFPGDLTPFRPIQPSGSFTMVGDSTIFDPNENDLAIMSQGFGQYALVMLPEGQVPPIPEPSTLLLIGSGLIALAAFSRRKLEREK